MEIDDREFADAERRMAELRSAGYAVAARFDRPRSRLVITLHNGVELAVPTDILQDLAGACADDLAELEITPAGLGLHWPKLEADVYVPGLLNGVFGTRSWMKEHFPAWIGPAAGSSPAMELQGERARKSA